MGSGGHGLGGVVRRRKFWGWGYEGDGLSEDELRELASRVSQRLGIRELRAVSPPRLEELDLRPPRVRPPAVLARFCSDAVRDRAEHTLGKSYRDLVRGLRREYTHPPDFIAYPSDEEELTAVLDWATSARVAVIPYGGGSSVVGGIEPDVGDSYRGAISVDLRRMSRVLEVDSVSRAALIEAGVLGPALEAQLRPHGLTLRHFPQSFEFSSLGGWIATRSGGHYATLFTRIDEFVESLHVLTPRGLLETRRLPSDGAGVSPNSLFIGSEGTLGIITRAWMRLQDRPRFRASASITFTSFASAAEATRELVQSGLWPANCRLLDPTELLVTGISDGSHSLLIVGFESADHPLRPWLERAIEICRAYKGMVATQQATEEPVQSDSGLGMASRWREAFIRGGHLHDAMVRLGLITETFETAVTWDRFIDFHAEISETTRRTVEQVCGRGLVSCRLTYLYPDGPAPYYTVVAPARSGSELAQWTEIKGAASETLLRLGGTITHHHAVGRDHRPWYDRQRPDLFAEALSAAKRTLDPVGVMNPGVLVDPHL
jgi:alkyldihydroxyacetonephosphate synthase